MYHIRPCLISDINSVLKLSKQWANEFVTIGYENVQHTEEKLVKFISDYFYVVTTMEEEIVGYGFGEVNKGNASPVIPYDQSYLEIYEVFIHPEHRKQGLGKRLVKTLITKAEENNVTRALVGSSNKKWEETNHFYEEFGFKMWYIQMYK
ncbi:GNAT family N-acetyltransferase [Lederbergia sp. NSJ-179]|uniref:GNAT family N-acetyltransferase n=1 Tax=Lederbergia sp. NSJ-179 TaxID=2931402 RepID=UPI001FD28423|nr:GNAT family N-acetyltransferase [Lederbergia sp. NSJ-179]MCJ7841593.1 GNAT family N-acetyltransferase [Lederbergia sp. NSJ-179]